MKFKTINGWNKERMKAEIMARMLDHKSYEDSWNDSTCCQCMYRAEDGNRCAVGVFIPDDKYDESMDRDLNVYHLLEGFPELKQVMPLETGGLLEMQEVHDATPVGVDPRPRLCEWIDENVVDDE